MDFLVALKRGMEMRTKLAFNFSILTAALAALDIFVSSAPTFASEINSSASTHLMHADLEPAKLVQNTLAFLEDFGNWIGGQDRVMLSRTLGVIVASASIASNWSALGEVRESIVSCVRPISFRGLGIGTSDDFIVPMRTLFFSFALYVFYELVSQFQNLFGGSSKTQFAVDSIVQLALFAFVAFQLLRIRNLAINRYRDENKKFEKFQRTFDKALAQHNIRMTDLVRGTFILPLASFVPKAYELLT